MILNLIKFYLQRMSFVEKVNPFADILCVPVHYIWIVIILCWIMVAVEIIYLYMLRNMRDSILNQKNNLKDSIHATLLSNTRRELKRFALDHITLPDEIISIIMNMLPTRYENWETNTFYTQQANAMDLKRDLLQYSVYIYPFFRMLSNFANAAIIFNRYAHWYRDHEQMSHWDKYCAFIIAWFYFPCWKGRGSNTLIGGDIDFKDQHFDKSHENILWLGVYEQSGFIILFCIISLPVLMSGMFIYVTTTLLAAVVFGLIWASVNYTLKRCLCIQEEVLGVPLAASLVSMWCCAMIIVCTMELYSGHSWVNAYKIGFNGEYCKETAYLRLGEWNTYTLDVQFLIVSWFIF
eukprot:832923_1